MPRRLSLVLCCLGAFPPGVIRAGSSEGRAGPVFRDVTAEVGLDGVRASWSAVWGDYDGDGWLDLVTFGHVKNLIHVESRMFRNNGGRFSDVSQAGLFGGRRFGTANCTHAGTFCDLDADGRLDLLVSQEITKDYYEPGIMRSNEVWMQQPGGGFADRASEAGLTGNWLSRGFYVWDFNRDGKLDVLLQASDQGRPEGNFIQLFCGEGSLQFRDIALTAGVRLEGAEQRHKVAVLGDFNGDGLTDIFSLHPAYLLLNHGDETFRDASAASGIRREPRKLRWHKGGAAAEDFDHDGDLDLVVAEGNERGGNRLYRNDGTGVFTDVTVAAGIECTHRSYAATWGDYDNDGWPDLYFGNLDQADGRKGPNTLYRNNGDGTFTEVTAQAGVSAVTEGGACDVMFVDYDNDGFLDLFCTNGESNRIGPVVLLRNGGNAHHWLKLRLVGDLGNVRGLGAKVTVRAGPLVQTREHTGPIHFMSQDDQPLHFGLGAATSVDAVEIAWPDGSRQVVSQVAADQTLVIRQDPAPTRKPAP